MKIEEKISSSVSRGCAICSRFISALLSKGYLSLRLVATIVATPAFGFICFARAFPFVRHYVKVRYLSNSGASNFVECDAALAPARFYLVSLLMPFYMISFFFRYTIPSRF